MRFAFLAGSVFSSFLSACVEVVLSRDGFKIIESSAGGLEATALADLGSSGGRQSWPAHSPTRFNDDYY